MTTRELDSDDQPLRCDACVSDGRGGAEVSETPAEVKHYNDIWWHTAHHIRHTRELSGEAVFAESEAIARRLTELQEQRDHALAELLTLQARATTPDTARTLADLQQAIYDLTDPCGDEGTVETIIETLNDARDVVLAGAVEVDRLQTELRKVRQELDALRKADKPHRDGDTPQHPGWRGAKRPTSPQLRGDER